MMAANSSAFLHSASRASASAPSSSAMRRPVLASAPAETQAKGRAGLLQGNHHLFPTEGALPENRFLLFLSDEPEALEVPGPKGHGSGAGRAVRCQGELGEEVDEGGGCLQEGRGHPGRWVHSAEHHTIGVVSFRWGSRQTGEEAGPEPALGSTENEAGSIPPVDELRSGGSADPNQLPFKDGDEGEVLRLNPNPAFIFHGPLAGLQGLPSFLQGGEVPSGAGRTHGPEAAPNRVVGQAMALRRRPWGARFQRGLAEGAMNHVRAGCSRAFSGGSRPVCS